MKKLILLLTLILVVSSCGVQHNLPEVKNTRADISNIDTLSAFACEAIVDTAEVHKVVKSYRLARSKSRVAPVNRVPIVMYVIDNTWSTACGGTEKARQRITSLFNIAEKYRLAIGIKMALGPIVTYETEAEDPFHGTALETSKMIDATIGRFPIYPADIIVYVHKGGGGGMSRSSAMTNTYYAAISIPTSVVDNGLWQITLETYLHETGHQNGLSHTHDLTHTIVGDNGKTYTSQAHDYHGTYLYHGPLESRDYKPVPITTSWMYPALGYIMSYAHLDYAHASTPVLEYYPDEIALMKDYINARADVGTDGISICKNDVTNFTYDGIAHWNGLFNSSWDICWGVTVPGNTKFSDWKTVAAGAASVSVYPSPDWKANKYSNGSSVTSPFTGSTTATVNDGLRFETNTPISLDNYTGLTEMTSLPAGTAYASSVWLNGTTKGKTVYGVVGARGIITIKLADYGTGLTVNRLHIRGDKYAGSLTYTVSEISLDSKTASYSGSFTFPAYPSGTKLTVKMRPTCNDPQVGRENTYYITTK